ncbi:MAG: VRR-NUC domain-containing protein [Proteobacteria bacterium]|nr:VRR-NUC domain-containing protein [Pseudomonadota bacterium]
MKQLEHTEQVNLMQWWALACHGFGLHENTLFAIPNGGARNAITGMNLKREGVRAGVPDLFLAWANRQYGGLFIEMKKSKGGRVSDAQKLYLDLLAESGYKVAVCHGWLEAKASIEAYLK